MVNTKTNNMVRIAKKFNNVPTIWWTSAHYWLRSVREFGAPLWISTGFASWQRYCTVLQQWASAKLCSVEQRAPPIFGRATITLGIGPHSIQIYFQAGMLPMKSQSSKFAYIPSNLSIDCKKNATENGNLQTEMESNEYSSSKNYWSSSLLE